MKFSVIVLACALAITATPSSAAPVVGIPPALLSYLIGGGSLGGSSPSLTESSAPSEAPAALETSAAPEAPAALEASAAPEPPAILEASAAPEVLAALETSAAPEAPAALENSAAPKAPSALEASAAPEAPAALEASAIPESAAPVVLIASIPSETPAPKPAVIAYVSQPKPVAPIVPVASVAPVAPIAPVSLVNIPQYVSNSRNAQTVRYGNEISPNGAFNYFFETDNGIAAQAEGIPRSFYAGADEVAPVVEQGSFAWISPEGQEISITYVADENGYRPTGNAIPQAPPIPPAILRSLEFIARSLSANASKK